MATEPREFEPLMSSIQRVLEALDAEADASTLGAAVQELREYYAEYGECCCRRAHVVPYAEQQDAK